MILTFVGVLYFSLNIISKPNLILAKKQVKLHVFFTELSTGTEKRKKKCINYPLIVLIVLLFIVIAGGILAVIRKRKSVKFFSIYLISSITPSLRTNYSPNDYKI